MTDRELNLGTKFTANTKPFMQGIAAMRKSLKNFATMSAKARFQAGQLRQSINAVGSAGTKTAAAAGRLAKAHSTLGQSIAAAQVAGTKSTVVTQQLGKAHNVLGKQIGKVSGGFERIKAAMRVTASYGVAATLIFSFTKALRFGAEEIVNFDQGLKNLEAITGANVAQLAAMSDVMLELARDTKFSATEISSGMVLLGQAGFSAEESLNAIKATSLLATGTLTSMQTTADLLTTTIRAFNLESIEAGRVADVFANAVNKSKLTVDKLRVAFNFAGAAASQAGLSLEQTAAAAMVLANSGLRASTIGTGLRQVLAKLIAPSEKLRESFAAHGIDLSKVNSEGFDFRKTLQYLTPILIDTKTGMVDMAKAFELFKLRGAQAAAVLIRGFATGRFDEMIEKVNRVGTAAAMAGIQQEGLAVKFKNLSDRAGTLAQAVGEAGVTGAMGGFIDVMKVVISAVENFMRSGFGIMTTQAIALTAAFFALTKSIVYLKTVISGLWMSRFMRSMKATGIVNALTQAFGKWNLVLLGVAAAIAAVVAIVNRYMGRTKRMAEEHDRLATAAGEAAQGLNLYRKVLEDLHTKKDKDSAEQYLSTVKRLAGEYKELGSATALLALSYEDFMAKIEAAENKGFDTNLREAIKTAVGYREVMDEVIKRHDDKRFLSPPGLDAPVNDLQREEALKQWQEDATKLHPKLAAAIDNSTKASKRAQDALLDMAYYGKINEQEQKKRLAGMIEEGVVVGDLEDKWKEFRGSLTNLRQDFKDFGQFSGIEKMPEQMKAIYESLTTVAQKIDFLKDAKALQSKIAGIKKVTGDFGIVGKEVTDIVKHLSDSFLNLQKAALVSPLADARWGPKGYAGGGRGQWGPRTGGMTGIEDVEKELEDEIAAAEKLKEEAQAAAKAWQDLLDKLATKRFQPRRQTVRSQYGPRRGGMKGLDDAEAEIEKKRVAAAALIKREAEETAAAYEFQQSTLGKMSPEIRKIYNGLSAVQKLEFAREFLSLQGSLADTEKQMTALGFSSKEVAATIKQMTDDFVVLRSQDPWGGMAAGLRDYTEKIKYAGQNWYDFTVNALSGMQNSWRGFFGDVMHDADSFSNTLKKLWQSMTDAMIDNWADMMAKMMMQMQGGLFEGIGSLFGGRPTTPLGGMGVNPFEKRAVGGPVSAGRAYIVGEKGKELFVPNDNGRILPNGRGGEAGVNVVVNNHSSEQANVTESRGPDNSRQIFVTIGGDIASGGPIAGAIERTYGLRRKGRIV